MPCCARASTSLVIAAFDVVSSSNSWSRSLIGRVMRATYLWLAKGCVTRLTRLGSSPSQKSVGVCGGSGSRAVWLAGAGVGVAACWDSAGSASVVEISRDVSMRFFIFQRPLFNALCSNLGVDSVKAAVCQIAVSRHYRLCASPGEAARRTSLRLLCSRLTLPFFDTLQTFP